MTAVPLPFAALDRDALTGLIGPEAASVRLDEWDAKARESGRIAPVHVMMLGLRRFETVNLAFGEEAGDSALVEVATRIQHFAQEELEGGVAGRAAQRGQFPAGAE